VDLRRQVNVIRRWFPLLVVSVVLSGGVAFAVSSAVPKTYEARVTLIVGQSLSTANPDYDQLLVSQRLSTTYAAVATKRPMLENVIEELGLGVSPDDLAKRVRANAQADSTLLTIVGQDGDPSRAAAIANELASQLISASPAIQGRQAEFQAIIDADLDATRNLIVATQARIDVLAAMPERTPEQEAELSVLGDRLVSLRATYATLLPYTSGTVVNLLSVIEPAVAPTEATSPRPLLNAFVAALLGLVAAAGLVSLAEYLDDTIKDPGVVEELIGLSTIGTIPRMRGDRGRKEVYRLASLLYPQSAVAESYRTLRTNVGFTSLVSPVRTLLVTSAASGEGKTVTAANLAVVFAQAGRRVLLVDADLRKPGVHLVLDLPNEHGLTSLLRSDDISVEAVARTADQENLTVVTTGPLPPNPAELLGSQRMRTILDRLGSAADLVIFDSPPVLAVADASILSSQLDGTLLVLDAERSRRNSARLARDTLGRAGAHVLGAVLNRVRAPSSGEYGAYYGGYDSDERAPRLVHRTGATDDSGRPAPVPGRH
jgi:non-specific protein-tyrosine kinase